MNNLIYKNKEDKFYYFGQRYYADWMGVWLSVDPASDMYPSTSPYMYVRGNPVKLTDPNGMWDDGFVIDEQGYTTRVNNEGGSNYDVIYNKSDYNAGKRDYDKSGTKSGFRINRGEVSNIKSKPVDITEWGEKVDETQRHSFEVNSKDVADNLHIFLDMNTDVEWSNQNYTDPSGNSVNVITTSKEQKTVEQGYELTKNYLKRGCTLNSSVHNHAWNDPYGKEVSGAYGKNGSIGFGDKGNKQQIQSYEGGKNTVFKMLYRGKYTPY